MGYPSSKLSFRNPSTPFFSVSDMSNSQINQIWKILFSCDTVINFIRILSLSVSSLRVNVFSLILIKLLSWSSRSIFYVILFWEHSLLPWNM